MPRSFDFAIESSASVEQIHSAFAAQDYWLARLAEFTNPALVSRLDTFEVDSDGAVTVVVVQSALHEGLPKLVSKFYPRSWEVVHTESWTPVGDRQVRGEISIASHGAPGSGRGTALLAPVQSGARLQCNATVEFRVPLVGGKIENVIGRQLANQFTVIQSFTTKWISENA